MESYIRKSLGTKTHWVTEVVETEEGWVALVDRLRNRCLKWGHCWGETKMTRGRREERRWRALSTRDKAFRIVYPPFWVLCPRCGLRVEGVPWARRWERVTQALAQAVALLVKKLSFKEVAEYFGLDWKGVVMVVKRVVEEGLKRRKVNAFLKQWLWLATHCRLKPLTEFARLGLKIISRAFCPGPNSESPMEFSKE